MDSPVPAPRQMARRLPRHETDNRVVLKVEREAGIDTIRGRCSNVSEAGFGAVLAGELQPGEVVAARLSLQAMGEPFEIRAQVRNRAGFRHGFRFLDITAEQRRTLMRYIHAAEEHEALTLEEHEAMNAEHEHEPHPHEPHIEEPAVEAPPEEQGSDGD